MFRIDAQDNTAFNVNVRVAAGGVSFMTRGQVVILMVRNVSGGVMGATQISLNTGFKASSYTPAVPANGKNRSGIFCYDGSNLVQIGNWGTADVDN